MSVHQAILEVIQENQIDLNSPYKLERVLCISKVVDKLDLSEYNPFQVQRKIKVIEKSVNMMFEQKKLTF